MGMKDLLLMDEMKRMLSFVRRACDDYNMIDGLVNNGQKPGSGRETEKKADIVSPYAGRMSVREALMKICEGCCPKETRKDISRLSRSKAEPVL